MTSPEPNVPLPPEPLMPPELPHRAAPDDPYAALPEFYDLEHAGFEDDVPLYLNVAEAVGDPVLELGCGTGRVLAPLAAAGFRVTGVDPSRPMLDAARASLAGSGLQASVSLHEGRMEACDAAPGGPFGLVLAPLGALMHAATPAAQRATLAACRRALDPRGQLVLDLLNPSPDNLRALDQGVILEGSWDLAGDRIDKFSSRRVRSAEQLIETELWYDRTGRDGSVRRTRSSFVMRYLHRAELEALLELCGFEEWEIYGGYDLEPFDDGSERLIVTADPTRSRA